ncbi:MAG: hypothetical protein GWN08_06115, partial [Gemmatimonadetes bacterium]|nr:hypothetical protein [Gemmatimonadota bacterium]
MAKYYQQKLRPSTPPNPAVRPSTGLKAMRRPPVDAAISGQDRIASLSRRVLCVGGIQGNNWLTENSATPRQTTPQNFPLDDTPRPCADGYVRLTPGCFPAVHVIYMLSGPCEVFVSGEPDTWVQERVEGSLRVDVTYHEWFSVTS